MLGGRDFDYQNNKLTCENIAISDIIHHMPTPFYLYSTSYLRQQYQIFYDAFAEKMPRVPCLVAFAVKACSNISLLKILAKQGAGADIVSGGELMRALKAGIAADKIMFSGVGKTTEEIKLALETGIHMFNVESVAELHHISQIASNLGKKAPISLRINPDVHATTLPGISTGKKGDKFGIPIDIILDTYALAYKLPALDVKGLDFHIGSQVLDITEFEPAFKKVRDLILDIRAKGYSISHLDCGGGLGVPYHPNDPVPDIKAYMGLIKTYFADLNVKLAFEPGRFLCGNAGILVSQVIYTKHQEDWHCLIVDAGMNDLMRPALYGAYHHLVPLTQTDRPDFCYDIVGPVCESTDTFAKKYTLPETKQGEYVVFLTAGAYGASMSNDYNSRPLIPEILVDAGSYRVIRKRPCYDEMFALEENI